MNIKYSSKYRLKYEKDLHYYQQLIILRKELYTLKNDLGIKLPIYQNGILY